MFRHTRDLRLKKESYELRDGELSMEDLAGYSIQERERPGKANLVVTSKKGGVVEVGELWKSQREETVYVHVEAGPTGSGRRNRDPGQVLSASP